MKKTIAAILNDKATKLPVERRALIGRINRKLRDFGQAGRVLKPTRGNRAKVLGDYYILDLNTKSIIEDHLNLEAVARQLGVLQPFEEITLLGFKEGRFLN
jgi:hypothetical protein